MRAVVFHEHGGPEVLAPAEVPRPEAGPGQVVVRVRACGVNRLDIWVRSGRRGPVPLPHIQGSEVAGEVAEVGPGVVGVEAGQRVVVYPWLFCGHCEACLGGTETVCDRTDILGVQSQGGYAEYVAVPAANALPLPPALDFVEGAAVTLSTLTAWHMVVGRARVQPGETVLVLAAGSGVGSAAVQIARLAGARVIATASSDAKLERARALGAEMTINTQHEDLVEAVRRLTDGRGADVVVEHVGAATWAASAAALAKNGRLVTCGATTGAEATENLRLLYSRQLTVLGSMGGTRHELRQVLAATAEGRLRPVVHATYPLERAAEAQRAMEAREQFGKLVLVVE
ncbi:MAG TPA: zinc-binding dehydrogenase [Chloroflexota bacterium]